MMDHQKLKYVEALTEALVERFEDKSRYILAITGVPAAGKSTLAAEVVRNAIQNGINAVLLGMDGYHMTHDELEQRGLRHLKGAPETFEVQRFKEDLTLLRNQTDSIQLPAYSRELHNPIENAITVNEEDQLVVVEGNYLLLNDRELWSELKALFDESWLLVCDEETTRQRLMKRHLTGGKTHSQAVHHIESVDLPNARLILEHAHPPDQLVNLRDH